MKTVLAIFVLLLGAAPVAAAEFGAIAYSFANEKYGRAWQYESRAQAEVAAMEHCAEVGGTNCQIALWAEDSCGAIARTPSTSRVEDLGASWGYGSQRAARDRAMTECASRNNGECRVIASVCSSGQ